MITIEGKKQTTHTHVHKLVPELGTSSSWHCRCIPPRRCRCECPHPSARKHLRWNGPTMWGGSDADGSVRESFYLKQDPNRFQLIHKWLQCVSFKMQTHVFSPSEAKHTKKLQEASTAQPERTRCLLSEVMGLKKYAHMFQSDSILQHSECNYT